jgi:hypothetical protein
MLSCRAASQSIAAYTASVDASAAPRSAPSVVSAHQVSVDSFEHGRTTLDTISATARSRSAQAGPSKAGSPSLPAMAWTAATWPCGTERAIVTASPAGTSCLPFRPASIRSTTCAGSADRLATVSFLTLPSSR